VNLIGHAGKMFDAVEYYCGGCHHSSRAPTCDGLSVRKFQGHNHNILILAVQPSFMFRIFSGKCNYFAVFGVEIQFIHQKLGSFHRSFINLAFFVVTKRNQISTNNLLFGSVSANIVIDDAKAGAIDSHIRGRHIFGFLPGDFFDDTFDDRKYFQVPVIVDGGFTICFQVEGVDHVHVPKICSCSFIGYIDRMLQRQIPYWECFKFSIANFDSSLIIVVKLRKAGG